jgi:hypothetical protein
MPDIGRVGRRCGVANIVRLTRAVVAVPITVGLFAWVGGTEWHIHAWDFAQVIGQNYRTEHARVIYNGTMAIRGRTPGDEDPWEAILSRWRQRPGVAH